MRRLRRIFFVAILSLLAMPAAYAEKRVALVIGNSAYRHTSELANPKNDAADMAATLRKHGFEVIAGVDLDKAAFDRKIGEFLVALKGSDAGAFFYAGHGLQVAGQNYLVPIDAKAEEAAALDLEMVRVDTVHRIMERQTETNILFLDACRDNPLARNLARSMGTRSAEIGRGLARVEAGVGTLISFSTQPGSVALDGAGRNSPYTGALVKRLVAPKEDLSAILIDVRNDVIQATRNKQVPWEHVALRARFYFSPPSMGPDLAGLTPGHVGTSAAERAWVLVKDSADVPTLEAFRKRHGSDDPFYDRLAEARIEGLKQDAAARERERLAALEKRQQEVEKLAGEERRRAEEKKRAENQRQVSDPSKMLQINNWTLGLAGGLPEGTFIRLAAEIARNLNDPEEMRVLPVITQGATDNVKDLLYLRGIDVAITNADVLDYFKNQERTPNIEKRINFISELVVSEVHLVVRPEINSIRDLEGKKVSLGAKGAGQSTTGPIVFKRLGVSPEFVYVNNAIAIETMKTGEIVAIVSNGAKPLDLLTKFNNDGGFKLLPIPIDRFDEYYIPATLTAQDYPGFIKPGGKVETLGVQTVLAVYNWSHESDRYRRLKRFVERYFDLFEKLRVPPYHPHWKRTNLAANVPGWIRYVVAEEKLKLIDVAKP